MLSSPPRITPRIEQHADAMGGDSSPRRAMSIAQLSFNQLGLGQPAQLVRGLACADRV